MDHSLYLQAFEMEEGVRRLLPGNGRQSRTGTVHSVYRSTVNLQLEDGTLIALSAKQTILAPFMIKINDDIDFLEQGEIVKPGNQVYLHGNKILISDRMVCDLTQSRYGLLAVPHMEKIATERSLLELNRLIRLYGKPGGMRNPWLRLVTGGGSLPTLHEKELYGALHRLAGYSRERREAELLNESASIVGMGIGLTPSADDFLTGFFTVLEAGCAPYRHWRLKHRDAWLESVRNRTTRVSFEMLKHVLNGKVNQAVLDLLSLSDMERNPEPQEWERRAKAVFSVGSSSGTDMVAGMACGLACLNVLMWREWK